MSEPHRLLVGTLRYSGLAGQIAGCTGVGFAGGWWLDDWLETRPLFMLLFGLAGMVGGIVALVRALDRAERVERKRQERDRER